MIGPCDLFRVRECYLPFTLSFHRADLLYVVHHRPLPSVAVSVQPHPAAMGAARLRPGDGGYPVLSMATKSHEFEVVLPSTSDKSELSKLAQGIIDSLSRPYTINSTVVSILSCDTEPPKRV